MLALSAGCSEAQESIQIVTDDMAVRQDGWRGIRNLSRAGDIYFGGQPDEETLRRMNSTWSL
jgi:hypothetical protein